MPDTAEEWFGYAVAAMRKLEKLSQRDFAEKLSAKGMPVDASAVSRIEKGTRSVRLTEALVIAEVLNTDLQWLVSGSKTPSQEFRDIRRATDRNLRLLVEPIVSAAWSLSEGTDFLIRHPELLADLTDDELGTPASLVEYLPWVARRVARWTADGDDDYVTVNQKKKADQIIEVITSLARCHIGPERREGDGDGQHPEEA